MQRHILISVIGLTPQVITETLYYCWCLASPKIPITQVFALTTLRGKQALENVLLGASGKLKALCDDYDLPPVRFGPEHIHLLKGTDGKPLEDIWSAQDNETVADQIFAFVREITAEPEICVHASIAGGRKTLGLYLGLAMQFYGRPGDTLSHVLVNPELESNPHFFYPPPSQAAIPMRDGQPFPADQIRVELAQVPLLLLREKIPFLKGHEQAGYAELVKIAQREYDALLAVQPVVIDRLSRSLQIGETVIKPTPLEFALYLFFARKHLDGCARENCPGCETCSVAGIDILDNMLLQPLQGIMSEIGMRDPRSELRGWERDSESRFRETRSKVNGKIKESLGNSVRSQMYQIDRLANFPGRGNARYGILLAKHLIHIL
ncbi:TIGR02584 family CRISPR-associated protein [Candidatus Poribacteria bacterium]|nr:TIGR02584 family CRISPR-associated protein [Candidatus Poribacteria bacterium]